MPSHATRAPSLTTEETSLSATSVLSNLLEEAYSLRASDIHLDPTEARLSVRFRIDGALETRSHVPLRLHTELISRIKILSSLRIDEHQRPQDGRFRHTLMLGRHLDVRVSIAPTYHGQNAVLRLLFPDDGMSTLDALGLSETHQKQLLRSLGRPHGLILATGPTGSGKTSTLYALLSLLSSNAKSIITIEDPIEYSMDGMTQMQTNDRSGLTFETGLRSILRQDPDIIMVGEVRDKETARLAVNAALTGHIVLTTLHTNDAPTALPRLLDLSVEPYLIPSTVSLIIAQRLARRICTGCRTKKRLGTAEEAAIRETTENEVTLPSFHFIGAGCAACNGTGYRGRIGVFELLVMDDFVRKIVLDRPAAFTLRSQMLAHGMRSLLKDGLAKAEQGTTTIEEILRLHHE